MAARRLQLEPGNVGVRQRDDRPTTTSSQILLDALARAGRGSTKPVSIAPRADVEAPSFTGSPNGTMAPTRATSG